MPGVYTGHTGGGVEYDTEDGWGQTECQREEPAVTPACLRLLEGLWDPDGTAGCRLTANSGIHGASPSVPDALVGVL